MATRKSDDNRTALQQKGFRLDPKARRTDHYYFVLYVDNQKTSVWTKVSHGGNHDVGDGLFSTMARQCKLTTGQFCDLIDCPLSENQYSDLLTAQGAVKKSEN